MSDGGKCLEPSLLRELLALSVCLVLMAAAQRPSQAQPVSSPAKLPPAFAGAVPPIPSLPEGTSPEVILALNQARERFMDGDVAGARESLARALKSVPRQAPYRATLLSCLAALAYGEGDYKAAREALEREIETYEHHRVPPRVQAQALKRIGDCRLKEGKESDALQNYTAALLTLPPAQAQLVDPLRVELLERITARLIDDKEWKRAEPFCLELVDQTRSLVERSGGTALAGNNVLSYLWASADLVTIFKNTGQTERFEQSRQLVLDLFSKLIRLRMAADRQGTFKSASEFRDDLKREMATLSGGSFAEQLWAGLEASFKSLPVLVWSSPEVKPWATVVCIHGLGLDNRSWEEFGRTVSRQGIVVVALDVRGFGSWSQHESFDAVDFDRSLRDIKLLLTGLSAQEPGLPLYLLGESMGGGIALRATAQYPELITGTIASVPGARRYQAGKTALNVARHFLRDPNKPFDIGTQVVDQASSDDKVRQTWTSDPKARLELSPKELVRFDEFMRENEHAVSSIKSTPVLMLQGVNDHLVKPESTYKLFNNISCEDRSLFMVGKSEHLMFELGNFSPMLIHIVTDWIRSHPPDSARASQSQAMR